MAAIAFLTEGISFKLTGARRISTWLHKVARTEKRSIESLTYIFCSDSYLKKLNKIYLQHNTLTDVLTFDYSERGAIQAEVYISVMRVKENAKTYSQPFQKELSRVIVHGLLHTLGYEDKTAAQIAVMRAKEEACLSLRP